MKFFRSGKFKTAFAAACFEGGHEMNAAEMREMCAAWHDEQADLAKSKYEDVSKLAQYAVWCTWKDQEDFHRESAGAIRQLSIF